VLPIHTNEVMPLLFFVECSFNDTKCITAKTKKTLIFSRIFFNDIDELAAFIRA